MELEKHDKMSDGKWFELLTFNNKILSVDTMFWSLKKCFIIFTIDDILHLLSEDDTDADNDYLPDNINNDTDGHSDKI